jgi:hypothetical protein
MAGPNPIRDDRRRHTLVRVLLEREHDAQAVASLHTHLAEYASFRTLY